MMLGEPKPEVSVVIENYLQAIYKLKEMEERVFPTRLAEVMSVSVATVVGTLKRLNKQGLVDVGSDKEVNFTSKGKDMGEAVVRRHRLAERMLTELLGVEWHRAHAEAHRMEHAISPYVEARLAKVLGYPKTNPFGQPIPGYSKNSDLPTMKPLTQTSDGESTMVERVPEEDSRFAGILRQQRAKARCSAGSKGTGALQGHHNPVAARTGGGAGHRRGGKGDGTQLKTKQGQP
jgi:DtxR family Mn-dependent transcriptional regulator